MNREAGRILLGCCLVVASGCDGLLPQNPLPAAVTITFVNDSANSGVELSFFSNADASVSPEDLTNAAVSEQLGFSVDTDASFQFVRACTSFQAAVVDRASLIVESGTGATASTPVLVDGMDFACGNFITFRLTSQSPDDLQIDVNIGDTNPLAAATDAAKSHEHAVNQKTGHGAAGATSGNPNTESSDSAAHETPRSNTNSSGTSD